MELILRAIEESEAFRSDKRTYSYSTAEWLSSPYGESLLRHARVLIALHRWLCVLR